MHMLFAVYDSKADAFMSVFSLATEGLATRWFAGMVNGGAENISRYPEDFSLFCLGMLDTRTGEVIPAPTPKSVCLGLALVAKKD